MKLEDIGFYTLSDDRSKQASMSSPLWRCELVITDKCNFKCPYCRGLTVKEDMPLGFATKVIRKWAEDGLKNIRFSGGEPTLHPHLPNIVREAKESGIERIAISTNGSGDLKIYDELMTEGVNDFSVSLDACCSKDMDFMSGSQGYFNQVLRAIKHLSFMSYVTVGAVFTPQNKDKIFDLVSLCDSLGVSDIRIIPSAQSDIFLDSARLLPNKYLDKYPILKYRVDNIKAGRHVRGGLKTKRCYLVLDDMAAMGVSHYPCIIYLREGGDPIGPMFGQNMRYDRWHWSFTHNVQEDKICSKNCLDVCIDYNQRCDESNRNRLALG